MPSTQQSANTVVVLDFETTGLSPNEGDRAIEVGAVKIIEGKLVDRFQQLMNPHQPIPSFIQELTGISNKMVTSAANCDQVMVEFADFIQGFNLVAHNASFDSKFLDAELNRINITKRRAFACSMLISRRIYPASPNHKLGTLVSYKQLPHDGTAHRALADSEMTAHLWLKILDDIRSQHTFKQIPFSVMQKLSKTAKASVNTFLAREAKK